MNIKLNLDVDSPAKVADVLRAAAETFAQSQSDLDAAWQPGGSGNNVWERIARVLDHAAHRVEQILNQEGW